MCWDQMGTAKEQICDLRNDTRQDSAFHVYNNDRRIIQYKAISSLMVILSYEFQSDE